VIETSICVITRETGVVMGRYSTYTWNLCLLAILGTIVNRDLVVCSKLSRVQLVHCIAGIFGK
jgi:hypothetical protein